MTESPPEIPDTFPEEEDYPRTLSGKLEEMRDIGKSIITQSDDLLQVVEVLNKLQERAHGGARDEDFIMFHRMVQFVFKLATLSQLQTEYLIQFQNMLTQPKDPG